MWDFLSEAQVGKGACGCLGLQGLLGGGGDKRQPTAEALETPP